uniref:Uncharacterized protein n=1 Tax=Romanomermis culicivorax TaxID=13658 RepID=A0A915JJI4_ROMCU
MFILIFYTLPLAFVASDHNVINGEDWTKENEFLNELFQTLESSKTKNAANFIDNSFAYTEQSPIDWSRVMTQLTAPSEKYVQKMLELLANSTTTAHSNPIERDLFIDCINAFGIASTITKSENSLFILGDGIQTVFAPNTYNVFLIGNDGKTIYGGSKDDIFIIYGNYSSGTIHGLGGHNVLDFSKIERQDGPPISIMAYPYDGADKLYITGLVFLEAFEIKEIIGRENQTDYVHASCQMQRIDLKGGEQYSADEIYLMDPYTIEQCKINLSIVLAGHTKIHGGAMNGKITYLIDGRQDTNTYLFSPCSSMNEILLHDVSLRNVNVNDSLNTIGIAFDAVSDADKIVKLSIETVRCPLDNTTLYFKDGFMKFTNQNQLLVFIKNLDYVIDDIIPRWRNLSSISTMVYMVGDEQVSRVFNGNQINYYDKDDALKSIQVFDSNWQSMKTSFCPVNSKVNYFDIDGVDNPNNLDIIIDCLDNSNQNHLWLTNFTKAMHRKGYRECYQIHNNMCYFWVYTLEE